MGARRTLTLAALLLVLGAIALFVLPRMGREPAALERGSGPIRAEPPEAPMLVGHDGGAPVPPAAAVERRQRDDGLRPLHVEVVRRGKAARRITIEVRGTGESNGGFHRRVLSDDAGRAELEVPPGPYLVLAGPRPGHLVAGPWAKARRIGRHRTPHLATVSVDVAAGSRAVRARLELPGTTIRVRVTEAGSNRLIEGADVTVHIAVNPGHLVTGAKELTDANGEAIILDLLPGAAYRVRAATSRYHRCKPQTLTLDAEHLEHEMELLLEPGGKLMVRLENEAGKLLDISAALRVDVSLEPEGNELRHSLLHPVGLGKRAKAIPWDRIAPGRYRVEIKDRYDKPEERSFQPVDSVVQDDVVVRAGETTEVTLRTRYRAYVTLQGQDGSGALDADLKLTVRKAGTAQVMRPAPWQRGHRHGSSHFEGYLPPGTYDVELQRGDGRSWHETLIVEREVIQKVFPAPWRD